MLNGPELTQTDSASEAKVVELDLHRPPAFTDEALALEFAEKHVNGFRYVATQGKWYFWTGTRWKQEDTLLVFDEARAVCRQAAAACGHPQVAKGVASAGTVSAVERLAKSDRRLAASIEQFDADPMLLNTPGGVIDLANGRMRSHQPEDYLTRITSVAPGGECPTFLGFLNRVCGDDPALVAFLQRMAGYALTGRTNEHALFFLYGLGANGKSVFINVISGILGEYHRTAAIETFTESSVDRHPTDLAGLRGARLVTAIETEEGRRWNESRIKTLTGGDMISARFMRQDFFDFFPQFKLVVAGNHKPGLRSVDEAIRRRFNLVPFRVTIPPEERDGDLGNKLKAEWPGILQWMIAGCLEWQQKGLRPPVAVTEATSEYLESEDALSAWVDDCCERDPRAQTPSADLFASWSGWSDRAGEANGTMKWFTQKLGDRGFQRYRKNSERGIAGLRLLAFR